MAATTALAVLVSGASVAGVGSVLAARFASAAEDARLRAVAATLASELDEGDAAPAEVAADEQREFARTGTDLAVLRGSTRLAGNPRLRPIPDGHCAHQGALRVCAHAAHGGLLALAASPTELLDRQSRDTTLAMLAALAVTALLGTLLSFSVARWAVAPLTRLNSAVARVSLADPGSAQLGHDDGLDEIDALRRTIRETLARLGHALAQSRRFSADAAHELRTPLTTILGELELLAEARRDDAEVGAAVARLQRTASRLARLVERLLVLAQPDAPPLHTEPVPLDELLEDLHAELPEADRARVVLDLARGTPPVDADRTLLTALFGNALENALKFSGDAPVHVTLRSGPGGTIVDLDDQGPGIAPPDRERVFEPLHRTAAARASGLPGHGLGLALVAHVARIHGATVAFVDGAPGARLRVVFAAASTPRS